MENPGGVISRTEAPQRRLRAALGLQPRVLQRHYVGSADGCSIARHARSMPGRLDLLASIAQLGRARGLAQGIPNTYCSGWTNTRYWIGKKPIWMPPTILPKEEARHRQNPLREGYDVHGVMVDGQGIPISMQLASAQLAECRLVESALAAVKIPRPGRGRPRSHIKRIIADRSLSEVHPQSHFEDERKLAAELPAHPGTLRPHLYPDPELFSLRLPDHWS